MFEKEWIVYGSKNTTNHRRRIALRGGNSIYYYSRFNSADLSRTNITQLRLSNGKTVA